MRWTLKDIVDEIYLETQDIDSIFRNKKRYNIVRYARQGLQELDMTFATHLKAISFEVPPSCRLYKPEGFEFFVRAYVLDCSGNTVEIKRNSSIPDEVYGFLVDCDGSILSDLEGFVYDEEIQCNEPFVLDSDIDDCLFGDKNPFLRTIYRYKDSWVKSKDKLDYIEFSPDLEGVKVVVEYLGNSVFEQDECLVMVESNLKEVLDYYIKFKLLENGVETMGQAQYYRQQFKIKRDKELSKVNALSLNDLYHVFLKK